MAGALGGAGAESAAGGWTVDCPVAFRSGTGSGVGPGSRRRMVVDGFAADTRGSAVSSGGTETAWPRGRPHLRDGVPLCRVGQLKIPSARARTARAPSRGHHHDLRALAA